MFQFQDLQLHQRKFFPLFLLSWLMLNLIQACFTELLHDEAYYWLYSRDLAWGYFDHPPLLALIIKVGYGIFGNELGVRLFIAFMNVGTLWLIWKTIDGNNAKLFIALICSTAIIHFGGFVAVPDIPLVFFVALYFYFFKRYLEEDKLLHTLGLFFAIVGMAYSKHLGVLVVFFSMLPNLKLLKRHSLWAIFILTGIALIPHLHWQYVHEFPTFRYQLFDRSQVPYKIEFFTNYILGQLLIFGPFIGFSLFPIAFRYKAKNDFEKTMKYCLYGFFGFFLLQSFRGRIEPNWTVMGAIPLFYLGYNYIENRAALIRKVYKIAIPSLIVIFIARAYLMYDFLPKGFLRRNEFHNWDIWARELAAVAGDRSVIFHNTFQKPSKYMFYTGKFAHAANYVNYAGKQFDLMPEIEQSLQGQTVLDVSDKGHDTLYLGGCDEQAYRIVEDFRYFNRIKIDIPQMAYKMPLDTILPIEVTIRNTSDEWVDFADYQKAISIEYCLFWYGKFISYHQAIGAFPVAKLAPYERVKTILNIQSPPNEGAHWRFRFAITYKDFKGRNSDFTRLDIIDR